MTTTQTQAAQKGRLFAIEDAKKKEFQEKFETVPFYLHHNLTTDPRFGMDSIKALAMRLPKHFSINGALGVGKGWAQPEAHAANLNEAMSRLEEGGSWIILKRINQDPEYADILTKCLSEVEELVHLHLEPEIESRAMSLILSSPGQVTPYHVDGDCNFLVQIQGSKIIYVFDGRDRSVLPEIEEENYWCGDVNAAQYREENQAKAWAFELKPGNGVHVPVMYPHWVKNGQNVSISISMNFRFHGRKRADVFRANRYFRKIGLKPRPVGKSKMVDSLKVGVYLGTKKVTGTLSGLRKRRS